jgi:hypothetical protein
VSGAEFADWIDDFMTRFPVVADDLLEAVDDYLHADPRHGDYALTDHDAALARIDRLNRLRTRLVAAHESP